MLSNCKKYMLTNLCGLLGGTVILSMIFHYVGNDFMVLPTIILGIFFCVANTVSIYARGMFASSHSNFITSFYLIDKVARFVASIMLIGIFRNIGIFEQGPRFAFGHSIIRILYICNGVGIVVFLCR